MIKTQNNEIEVLNPKFKVMRLKPNCFKKFGKRIQAGMKRSTRFEIIYHFLLNESQ